MRGINRVTLLGNVGQGRAASAIRRRVRRSRTCGSRRPRRGRTSRVVRSRKRTEWHSVALFRKIAEIAGEYLTKGSQVFIEGPLRTRKYQDKEGRERTAVEIVANELQLLGGRGRHDDGDAPRAALAPNDKRGANGGISHAAAATSDRDARGRFESRSKDTSLAGENEQDHDRRPVRRGCLGSGTGAHGNARSGGERPRSSAFSRVSFGRAGAIRGSGSNRATFG
jgi:single-strand DNA-binding protein